MARRMTSPVMVGRTAVLDQLLAALAAARAGEPRHMVIGGEAGVGKTRLLTQVHELANGQGSRVLLGGCVTVGDTGLPFAPFTEILRSLVAQEGAAAIAAAAGRSTADLSRLVPALSANDAPREDGPWAQARLYEALLDFFRHMAERTPLVVQLEDMHWADSETLAATSYLLRAMRDVPVTILATFRTDEITRKHPLRPWLAEVARNVDVERLDLEPLDLDELGSMARHILGEDLPALELDEIHRRSDGNPFFAEELLCCRAEIGQTLTTPLRDVLLTRVDLLPDETRQLLSVAAVGGREVEHTALAAVAGGDDDAIPEQLHLLVDQGLLVAKGAAAGDDAYSFRHALLQEAVYDSLLPTERRRLHRSWGDALAAHGPVTSAGAALPVQLAYHWREARDARALAASIAAGDAAMAGFSYGIAAREYEAALLLWDDQRPAGDLGIDHVALVERTSRAAYMASDYRRAVALCREAIDELGTADLARLTTLRILLGRTLWVSGDQAASILEYEEALRIAPPEPPLIRVRALAGLGQAHMLRSETREARPLCEEAVQLARAIGARDLEGHALNTLGIVLANLGEIDAALESSEAALRIAVDLALPDDIGRAYVNLPEVHNHVGYPERALAAAIVGIRAASDWGVARSYGTYIGYGAVQFAFESGQWAEATRLLAGADRTANDEEDGTAAYRATYVLELLVCQGDERASSLWSRAHEMVSKGPASDNLGTIFLGGIELSAFAERFEEAADIAFEGLEMSLLGEGGLRYSELARVAAWPVAEVGRRALGGGDAGAAKVATDRMGQLEKLARDAQEHIGAPGSRLARVLELNRLQVEAERERMLGSADAQQWRSLAEGWSEIERPFRAALARWREAEAAETSGHRDVAVAALQESFRLADELGARPLLGKLETVARRMRTRLGDHQAAIDSPSTPYGLTPREREVLTLVARGRTNKQIAKELFISESTAGVHVSNILGKLGAASRTEAARIALDQGLIAP